MPAGSLVRVTSPTTSPSVLTITASRVSPPGRSSAAPTRATTMSAAATPSPATTSRLRRRVSGRGWSAKRARTRSSKPRGGSSGGTARSRRSATEPRLRTSSRQLGQLDRWPSSTARSSPSTMSRARSAACARTSSHGEEVIGPPAGREHLAHAAQAGADAGLGGAERDVLDHTDLLCGPAAERGEQHGPALLVRAPRAGHRRPADARRRVRPPTPDRGHGPPPAR